MAKGIPALLLLTFWGTAICQAVINTVPLDCETQCQACKNNVTTHCPTGNILVTDGDPCSCCDTCVILRDRGEACGIQPIMLIHGQDTKGAGISQVAVSTWKCRRGLECVAGVCDYPHPSGLCEPYSIGLSYLLKCDERNNFMPVQCSKTHCWCVNQFSGATIPNTKVTARKQYRKITSCNGLILAAQSYNSWIRKVQRISKQQYFSTIRQEGTGIAKKGTIHLPGPITSEMEEGIRNAENISEQAYAIWGETHQAAKVPHLDGSGKKEMTKSMKQDSGPITSDIRGDVWHAVYVPQKFVPIEGTGMASTIPGLDDKAITSSGKSSNQNKFSAQAQSQVTQSTQGWKKHTIEESKNVQDGSGSISFTTVEKELSNVKNRAGWKHNLDAFMQNKNANSRSRDAAPGKFMIRRMTSRAPGLDDTTETSSSETSNQNKYSTQPLSQVFQSMQEWKNVFESSKNIEDRSSDARGNRWMAAFVKEQLNVDNQKGWIKNLADLKQREDKKNNHPSTPFSIQDGDTEQEMNLQEDGACMCE